MYHSRQRYDFVDAVLARVAISEQRRIWADQTIIVERLHHGSSAGTCSGICGWRNKWEGIVEMYDAGTQPIACFRDAAVAGE